MDGGEAGNRPGLLASLPYDLHQERAGKTPSVDLHRRIRRFGQTSSSPEEEIYEGLSSADPDIEEEARTIESFSRGSTVRALELDEPFDHYLFIEKNEFTASELESVCTAYPDLAARITVVVGDANAHLARWCRSAGRFDRAVVFLDPFGMQVRWETVAELAASEKVDVWYLFR